MADITLNFDGVDYVIDEALFTGLKEEAFDRLKKTPHGLDSNIEQMDFETFRRMLSVTFPTLTNQQDEAVLANAVGFDLAGGIQGMIFQVFKEEAGGSPTPNLCIPSLTKSILRFGSTDIDGETTPLNDGLWDANDVEDLCLKTAKALQRCLSGQEIGY